MKWRHKTKYKGQKFLAGYETVITFDCEANKSCVKRMLKLKNAKTGRELKDIYGNAQALKAAGWVKVK